MDITRNEDSLMSTSDLTTIPSTADSSEVKQDKQPKKSVRVNKLAAVIVGFFALVALIGGYLIFINPLSNEKDGSIKEFSKDSKKSNPESVTIPCRDFDEFSRIVLAGISDKYQEGDVYGFGINFRWKRNLDEPFIGYPIGKQTIKSRSDFSRDGKETAYEFRLLTQIVDKNIRTAVEPLGLTIDPLNTLPLSGRGLEVPDVRNTQIFGLKKRQDLYSVIMTATTGGTGIGDVTVLVRCSVPSELSDQIYNTLQIKSAKTIQHIYEGPNSRDVSDESIENKYEEDYIDIADVSPDKKVFVLFGSDNHNINIASVYYFDGNSAKIITDGSYPAVCDPLEKLKIGLGMRCTDPNRENKYHEKVVY